jgi:hypothetical protein
MGVGKATATPPLEKAARRAWLEQASDVRYGVCGSCRRAYDDQGGHLLVTRQAVGRRYRCLQCWDQGR